MVILGTILGQRMLEICSKTMRKLCWYSTDYNTWSIQLAQKVVLELQS